MVQQVNPIYDSMDWDLAGLAIIFMIIYTNIYRESLMQHLLTIQSLWGTFLVSRWPAGFAGIHINMTRKD